MDAFSTFEFDLAQLEDERYLFSEDKLHEEKDSMKQLVDADTKLSYGGYCVIA